MLPPSVMVSSKARFRSSRTNCSSPIGERVVLEDAELSVFGYATTEQDAVARAFKAKPDDVGAEKGELVAVDKASGHSHGN